MGILDESLVLGYGGLFDRHNKYKGIDVIDKIMSSLNKETNITFVTFGSKKIVNKINNLNIINLGYLDNDREIKEFYSLLDVYLSLSSKEAFGQTILEAQSCSVPCMIFDQTGSTDIISKEKNNTEF